jgi:hypothetical protein
VEVDEFLARLAVVEPHDGQPLRADVLREINLGSNDEYNIVLTARTPESLASEWHHSACFVFLGADVPSLKKTERIGSVSR